MNVEGWNRRFNEIIRDNPYWDELLTAIKNIVEEEDFEVNKEFIEKKLGVWKSSLSPLSSVFPGARISDAMYDSIQVIKDKVSNLYEQGNAVVLASDEKNVGEVKMKVLQNVYLTNRRLEIRTQDSGDRINNAEVKGYYKGIVALNTRSIGTLAKIMGSPRSEKTLTPNRKYVGIDFKDLIGTSKEEVYRKYKYASYADSGKLKGVSTVNNEFNLKQNTVKDTKETFVVIRSQTEVMINTKQVAKETVKIKDNGAER